MGNEIKYNKNLPSTNCKLIQNRHVNKKIIYENGISMIFISEIDEEEIIFVAYGFGCLKIYDCQCLYEINDFCFSSQILNLFLFPIRRIIKIKNRLFLISTVNLVKLVSLVKNNSGNYFISESIDFLIEKPSSQIIHLIKLDNKNIIILYRKSYIQIYKHKNEENFENEVLLKNYYELESTINLNNTLENYDMIEINNNKIAYINEEYLAIFSLETKQIISIFNFKLIKYTDDILRRITNEIICVGINNILYFISSSLGIVIGNVILPNTYRIVGMGDLTDNNIILATVKEIMNENLKEINLIQVHYVLDKNIKKLNVGINSFLKFEEKGLGNIFIKELKNKKITMSSLNNFYILN